MAKKKKFRVSRIIFIFLVLYLIVTLWNQNKILKELRARKSREVKVVEKLEEEISILEEEISQSDSLKFIEKVAREELGMVKPREIIIIDKNRN